MHCKGIFRDESLCSWIVDVTTDYQTKIVGIIPHMDVNFLYSLLDMFVEGGPCVG